MTSQLRSFTILVYSFGGQFMLFISIPRGQLQYPIMAMCKWSDIPIEIQSEECHLNGQ